MTEMDGDDSMIVGQCFLRKMTTTFISCMDTAYVRENPPPKHSFESFSYLHLLVPETLGMAILPGEVTRTQRFFPGPPRILADQKVVNCIT